MASFSLLLVQSPLNRAAGTSGLIAPLTVCSGLSATFKNDDIDSLNFTMPLRHYQTALIKTGENDVLLELDGVILQRFRVTARPLSENSVSVTCSSYREIVNQWLFHEGDVHNTTAGLAGQSAGSNALDYNVAAEQTLIAWTIINEGQVKSSGDLGLTRGTLPRVNVDIPSLYVVDTSTAGNDAHFFAYGDSRGGAVSRLAAGVVTPSGGLTPGFDWDIEPDPADPTRLMKFNVWNKGERGTGSPAVLAPFLLSATTMALWTRNEAMADYANVLRLTGADDTSGNVVGGQGPVVWTPSTHTPTDHPERGRWEIAVGTDLQTSAQVTAAAARKATELTSLAYTWTATLAPDSWAGKSDFWLGDTLRMLLRIEAVDDDNQVLPATYLLDEDTTKRVVGITMTAGDDGALTVNLDLDRVPSDLLEQIAANSRQLAQMRVK